MLFHMLALEGAGQLMRLKRRWGGGGGRQVDAFSHDGWARGGGGRAFEEFNKKVRGLLSAGFYSQNIITGEVTLTTGRGVQSLE
jgi:hypothetical protein